MEYRYYHLNFVDENDEFICKATISNKVYKELKKRASNEQMIFENYISHIIYGSTGLFLCGFSDAGIKKPHPIWNTDIMRELRLIFGYGDDKIIKIRVDRDRFISSAEELLENLKTKFNYPGVTNVDLKYVIDKLEANIKNMNGG